MHSFFILIHIMESKRILLAKFINVLLIVVDTIKEEIHYNSKTENILLRENNMNIEVLIKQLQ